MEITKKLPSRPRTYAPLQIDDRYNNSIFEVFAPLKIGKIALLYVIVGVDVRPNEASNIAGVPT